MSHLSIENILLKDKIIGLERALMNARKPLNKKKPLLLGFPLEKDSRALFISPTKV